MPLPERLFYPLDKAARHISDGKHQYDIEDILHYAEIGRLELLMRVNGDWAITECSFNEREVFAIYTAEDSALTPPKLTVCFLAEPPSPLWGDYPTRYRADYILESELCFISIHAPHYVDDAITGGASISGLMALDMQGEKGLISDILQKGGATLSDLYLTAPSTLTATEKNPAPFSICAHNVCVSPNQLYVSHKELELLRSGGRNKGSLITVESRKPTSHAKQSSNTIDPRSSIPDFIRNLLVMHYGEQYRDKPWLCVSAEDSDKLTSLQLDFIKAGLPYPTRKTIMRWFSAD
ncbi:hypothetical protein HU960_004399 [Salmonella enterica]|nr:hypothetical protein [Salmonella enterica subsp. enterica serovar Abaetetuba]EFT9425813.1 hypothetical protein [Salmonella enterica]EIJ8339519.1 hypothetical protein [Salmonella enterica]